MPRRPARRAATPASQPPDASTQRTVLVDAENVRRSIWPNIPGDELVALSEDWAREHEVDVVVVFEREGETADEWLIREAARFSPYWLVTSDRELRELAGRGAERVIGGGSFARELLKRR
ncbi:MAG: hypothetical protein H0W87_08055 [Actinobacteria bacterium]|nr:hypothetical protein [Actinomycetota bacterium]